MVDCTGRRQQTAGTMVAPAGEFKPRTSAKVRFEFAMNIYTEPAAPATETATDSTAPQAQSWRDTLPIHPAAELFPLMSPDELRGARQGHQKARAHVVDRGVVGRKITGAHYLTAAVGLTPLRSRSGPAIVGAAEHLSAGKDFLAVNKVIVLDRSVDPYAYVICANISSPPSDRRAEARTDRQADRGRPEEVRIGRSPRR